MKKQARFVIVGVGPGDPDLLTLKAVKTLAKMPVIAWFSATGRLSCARAIASAHLPKAFKELHFTYPFTTQVSVSNPRYAQDMDAFYTRCANEVLDELGAGHTVALLCEGDPFLYGSAMYLFDRLATRVPIDVIPGISGMSGCWSAAHLPMVHGDDVLNVIPATLDEASLRERLRRGEACVIMKLGRNLAKIRGLLVELGREREAVYVERGTQPEQRVCPLNEAPAHAPYFSLILIPGRKTPR